MNKWEKEVQKSLLSSEEAALKELEKQYAQALKEIQEKVKLFQVDIDLLDQALSQDGMDEATKAMLKSRKQSKIYQQQYQKALQDQVGSILNKMHGDNYTTIDKYLKDCYESGYIGTMYNIANQGIPIITPIDQSAVVKAVLTDSKVSNGLYNALGVDVSKLKKTITQEISRGIATGMGYGDMGRNISNVSKAPLSRTKTIARTEGHRIQQTSTADAQAAAKDKGADVLKQWDAALDGRTRDSHRRVDGEIRELDEKFSNGLMFPGDPNGGAAEVVNCRCTSDTRARWALDEDELEELKQRAAYFGLDKTENFEDFKGKYLVASKATQGTVPTVIPQANSVAAAKDFDALDNYMKNKYNITVDASVKKLDFDNVRAALTGVEAAMQDLPEIGNNIRSIATSNSGVMCCDGKSVFFNPKYFTDHNTMLDLCKKYDGGFWVRNVSPASIGYHESAHAFEEILIYANNSYQYGWQRIKAWNDCTEAKVIVSEACKNIKKTLFGKGKKNDELKGTISRYAKDTASETMAEAYADVFVNGSNASPLSLEIVKLAIERYKVLKGIKP